MVMKNAKTIMKLKNVSLTRVKNQTEVAMRTISADGTEYYM